MRTRWLSGLVCAIALAAAPVGVRGEGAAPPTPAQALEAYGWLDAWVRAWTSPPRPEEDARRIACSGAAVTLRLGGRVLGRATSVVGDGADVHRAGAGAWREASGRLMVERDATAEERIEVLAQRVTIELELSGAMTPIEGATFERAAMAVSPGLTGVAMRTGETIDALYPGVQLGTGLNPVRALQAVAGALGLPPVELAELGASHGAVALRFDAVQLAQVEPGRAPTFLHRGGYVVPQSEVTGAGLRASARAMAKNLENSMWSGTEPFGIRGDYRAVSGLYEPPFARPRSQALAALALVRFAGSPGVGEADRAEALATCADVLADLGTVVEPEEDPVADPVAAAISAAVCPMLLEALPGADRADTIRVFGARTLEAILAIGAQDEAAQTTTGEERAVVAWALASIAQRGGADAASCKKTAEGLVRRLVREGGVEGLVSLMPWIAWATLELHPEGEVPGGVAFRDVRSVAWAHQVGDEVASTPNLDFEGGVVFSESGGVPTASTLRVVSAAGAMLGDRRLTTDEEFLGELARVRRSLRFVMQLMFRAEEAHLARNPQRAIGGVRPAPWEPVASIDATAMGLVTVCDALEAVGSRAAR